MPEPQKTYRKLPGRAGGIVGLTQLWAGDDHIISVTSAFGFERYRRFFYRDIEGVTIRRTKVWMIWNIILGAILAAAVVIGWFVYRGEFEPSVDRNVAFGVAFGMLGIPTSIAFIALLVNSFRGPSVEFWVQTAGGLEKLDAPVRLGPARRTLKIIAPRIVATRSGEVAT